MKNIFLERFKDICLEIDKAVKPIRAPEVTTSSLRFNIHQRSLPVGLDKPVAFFLSESDAIGLLKRLKTKVRDDGSLVYYDVVTNTNENGSVFYNDGKVILNA